ncbi:MAG: hypothetical protein CSB33_03855 [Desulfobacterales bacterium]|nr:MAG: hypothetical protein CSB33_03855 [Desulfobacterales bacterium]
MKRIILSSTLTACFVIIFSFSAFGMTLDLGKNITISDKNNATSKAWYTDREDQEVEPGMQIKQEWDLEGFFLKDTILSVVGGYDFRDGYGGRTSGDIFLDIDGDAAYGDIHGAANGPVTSNETYGYEYALDLDFSSMSYDIIDLAGASTTTAYYKQNYGSNPWQYAGGGTIIGTGTFGYQENLSNTQTGFEGGNHYLISGFDLDFLGPDATFIAHYTMSCGNDNLMGAVATPEPGTIILMGLGLSGLVIIRRKRS